MSSSLGIAPVRRRVLASWLCRRSARGKQESRHHRDIFTSVYLARAMSPVEAPGFRNAG